MKTRINFVTKEIQTELFENQDKKYRDFQLKLIPGVKSESVIGVRTPVLRSLAKSYAKNGDIDSFLKDLPHNYFDENQLHSFIISLTKDFDKCLEQINDFLPFVDNWATCDQLSPKVFARHAEKLPDEIEKWLSSDKIYTIRFGIGMLMQHFLDDNFDEKYLKRVSEIKSDDYYVKMMIAWYFATALAKQYDEAVKYLQNKTLDKWVHNKTVQKAVESYRIIDEQKEYLKTLKVK